MKSFVERAFSSRIARRIVSLPLALCAVGCAADMARQPGTATVAAPAPAPAVLARSLYSKDSTGSLTEDDLQRVLEAPIDLAFPARVGVVPLAEPFDAKGPVSLTVRSAAAERLARTLVGSRYYSHVSDVATELPNGGGIEGLRVIAARYRLRYLVLYTERIEDDTHLNAWAWTYPTLVGMFITPGVTVASRGVVQADLLDVRTGTVLFSSVEPFAVSEQEWMVGAARAHKSEQAKAAAKAAERLGRRVVQQTEALVAFADRSADGKATATTRILPAPVVRDSAQTAASAAR